MTTLSFNIIFDLGGVVLEWNPDALVAEVFEDSNDRIKARAQIIGHPDWLELDRGTLKLERAIKNATRRTGLAEVDIRRLMALVPASLRPMQETIELIKRLKRNGHRLYCLSNMHLASIAYLEEHCSFWPFFDGVVISSYVKLIKPEKAIYEHLLKKYQLTPEHTIFIDDVTENLAAAETFGIRTIKFISAKDCEKRLWAIIATPDS
ncbi:HAD family phosphatase [bacterium]|nr:HAD family phosphatase [bacterium]